MKFLSVTLFAIILSFGSAHCQTTDRESLTEAMIACTIGLPNSISGELKGSIRGIVIGEGTGPGSNITINGVSAESFFKQFFPEDRIDAYNAYVRCLRNSPTDFSATTHNNEIIAKATNEYLVFEGFLRGGEKGGVQYRFQLTSICDVILHYDEEQNKIPVKTEIIDEKSDVWLRRSPFYNGAPREVTLNRGLYTINIYNGDDLAGQYSVTLKSTCK